ncbi:dUTP diphosphatase [Corynebacterium caspium]|uniref:dUTP diphosphatase n=1 Tax=Corynebacterium caspium TaxID=234828 RepID=UPI000367AB84|nr:dUTP diphosphatase [Corynebacterium caspium]WKD59154.1 Deoxyuridine 5'-triphosphate nucleotidohydrolase [Corynebacterium caspium DSM 44850]
MSDSTTPVPSIAIKKLHPQAQLPVRAHHDDAGADLFAVTTQVLQPGERALIPTGIALELPVGTVGLIHPRSGLAARFGISIVNSPGTIDAGYRGEIKVCLINLDPTNAFTVEPGMRIAQLLVQKVELVDFHETTELDSTARGMGGYGSTGFGSLKEN